MDANSRCRSQAPIPKPWAGALASKIGVHKNTVKAWDLNGTLPAQHGALLHGRGCGFCGVKRRPSSNQTAFYRRMSSRVQQGGLWLQQQAMERGRRIAIPLKVEPLPPSTLRIILPANGQAAIHDAVEEAQVCGTRGCGDVAVGVDKGCTEVHLDRDGERHKARLGNRLSAESDHRKVQGRRRNRLPVVVEHHAAKGRHRKPTPSGKTTWATGSGNGGSPCTTDRCATVSVRQPIPWWTRPAPSPARTCLHPCSPPRTTPVA